MSVTGEPGGAPVRAGVAISDLAAGLWGALGALAGYTRRLRDGHGSHVEVPLLDAALSLLTYVATDAMATGVGPEPVGSGHQNIVPYRAFATSDGWVVIAGLGDKFWPMLCEVLELDEMAAREDLRSNDQRTTSRAEVDAAVEEAVARLSTAEALRRLTEGGIPNAPINSMIDALTTPYVKQRGLVTEVTSPEGPYHVVQGPLRDGRMPRPAPALGEHTAEVMSAAMGADSVDLAEILRRWAPVARS